MAKIAGIKGQSPEAYPPDNTGQSTIHTQSLLTERVDFVGTLTSLLPHTLQAGGAEERIIVMFSGQIQWPNVTEVAAAATVTAGIYLDGSSTPSYLITFFVPQSTVFPNPPQPVPFSLFWETPSDGAHTVDIKAQVTTATVGATSVNGSLVLITTPV